MEESLSSGLELLSLRVGFAEVLLVWAKIISERRRVNAATIRIIWRVKESNRQSFVEIGDVNLSAQ